MTPEKIFQASQEFVKLAATLDNLKRMDLPKKVKANVLDMIELTKDCGQEMKSAGAATLKATTS